MIERHWKGIAKTGDADRYIAHLMKDTFPKLSSMSGFIRASVLRNETDKGVEFLVVTVWESLDAIKQFAGNTFDIAVVPSVVQQMMVEFDKTVLHYELAASYVNNKKRDN